MKTIIQKILRKLNIGLIKYDSMQNILSMQENKANFILSILNSMEEKDYVVGIKCLNNFKSQLMQDLFVLYRTKFKQNGFFVEFGATNGIDLSNTYLLETEFGWNGILAEPDKYWHTKLIANRTANIDTRCVWKSSGEEIKFCEANTHELSTIYEFKDGDKHSKTRKNMQTYAVTSISLEDLLNEYKAPYHIDYLSIDTEGSEYEILSAFDFSKYHIEVITCEHNYTKSREKIYNLLANNGYKRVYEEISQFDDWYVKAV